MNESSCSIVLGTVQLGFSYGIANKTGQPDQETVNNIVRIAWKQGIREFDTAQDYGVSEQVLGIAFEKLGISSQARVISKIDPEIDHCDREVMVKAVETSLTKMCIPNLFGLMLHKEELLEQWSKGLKDIFLGFRTSGKVKKLGVSVYSPDKAEEALNLEGIDLVQIPSNILDRRFERKNIFELANTKKKQIYIRSVFLQGLILMGEGEIPDYMLFAKPIIDKIKQLSLKLNMSKQELALLYLKQKAPDAKLVIGSETSQQVMKNVDCWRKDASKELVSSVSETFDQVDEKILNPSLWRSKS
ncbi:MAG: aldo/keto reductase [PVC group bacterium]|nr:aldo/keto reductase [PVC group bacterium]